jgi:hypothetical protein
LLGITILCGSILGSVGTIAASAVAATIAWIVTNFFAEPLLSFYKRRRAIHESLLYSANVSHDVSSKEDYLAVYAKLRRHAAAINALEETAPALIKYWLHIRKFNLKVAGTALIGLGNSLSSDDGVRGKFRRQLQKALRFSQED